MDLREEILRAEENQPAPQGRKVNPERPVLSTEYFVLDSLGEVGSVLRLLRSVTGRTQEGLATDAGYDKRTAARMEKSKPVSSLTLINMFAALGYEVIVRKKHASPATSDSTRAKVSRRQEQRRQSTTRL